MEPRVLLSISIVLDYSHDSDNFFTQPRRDLFQVAANALAASLNDSLAPITPDPASSNNWTATFPDPATGVLQSVNNLTIPTDAIIVYVGGGKLPGNSEAGLASTGGYSATGDQTWLNIVAARGKAGALATPATAYGPWGGAITFDDSGSTAWYFGQSLAGLTASQTDFLSVAEHELGHVLGLGTSTAWQTLVSGGSFVGPNAEAANGGQPVPLNSGRDHWTQTVRSDGGPALMNAILTNGTRVLITSLDLAALKDLGWNTQLAPPVVQLAAPSFSVAETAGQAVVTLNRAGGLATASVNYATSNGTAAAGLDYTAVSGTAHFGSGEATTTFTIPVINRPSAHGAVTVNLTLSNPSGNALLGAQTTSILSILQNPSHPPGDFFGNGQTDLAVYRPSASIWIIQKPDGSVQVTRFGDPAQGDLAVPADFAGVGNSQLAVYRPSLGLWIIQKPGGAVQLIQFGDPSQHDIAVPADYAGVGYAQLAVYRPSDGLWIIQKPGGGVRLVQFGDSSQHDVAVPADYAGVGYSQLAVYRPSAALWIIQKPAGGVQLVQFGDSTQHDVAVPGDYAGLGYSQLAVYRPSTGLWIIQRPGASPLLTYFGDSSQHDIPALSAYAALGTVQSSAIVSTSSSTRKTIVAQSNSVKFPQPSGFSAASTRTRAGARHARSLQA